MAKKKETRGRKPVPELEKTIQVQTYVKTKYIQGIGGIERAREIAKSAIEHEYYICPKV